MSYSGRGDKILKIRKPESGAVIAVVKHVGSANFAIFSLGDSLQEQDLLVNTIGGYSGTVLLDKNDGQESRALKITADGRWTITLEPLTSAPRFSGSTKGKGDAVLVYMGPVGTGKFTHRGQANFAVSAYSADSTDLLVNEIGNYSGENVVPKGPAILEITADGTWTVAVTG